MASDALDSIPATPVVHPNGNCFCGDTTKPARERTPKQSKIVGRRSDCSYTSRGGGIRTHDLFVPNEARYQAAPHPA